MTKDKVSILIPLYNSEKYIAETIESCLAQIYKNIEIIIVDDGSTDNSYKIAKSFEGQRDLKVYQQENSGACTARNLAFKMSKGQWIQYLDADDCIAPNKINKQISELHKTKTNINICSVGWYDTNFIIKEALTSYSFTDENCINSSISEIITTLSPIYSRELVEKTGGYDENLKGAQDWDFNLRVALQNPKYSFIHDELAFKRNVKNSLSDDYIKISIEAGKVLSKLNGVIDFQKLNKPAKNKIFWIYFENVRAEDISFFDNLLKSVRNGFAPKKYFFLQYKLLAKLYFVLTTSH